MAKVKRKAVKAPEPDDPLARLQARLGYRFNRPELLLEALTHSSFAMELADHGGGRPGPDADNERLEFLGDATLGFVMAEALWRRFPECREGELTRLRASVVSGKHLRGVGEALGLADAMRLGKGAAGQETVWKASSVLADAVEAALAAVYVDGGIEPVRELIDREILQPAMPELQRSLADGERFAGAVGDYKSLLQERLQAAGLPGPEYRLLGESGPGHQLRFHMEVRLHAAADDAEGSPLADAEASTKKAAQQEAARLALERLPEFLPQAGKAAAASTQPALPPPKKQPGKKRSTAKRPAKTGRANAL